MKIQILALAALLSVNVFAQSDFLKIPLFVETSHDKEPVPAAVINKRLADKKITGKLPIFFVATDNRQETSSRLNVLKKKVEAILAKLGDENASMAWESTPGNNNHSTLVTCYAGEPENIVDIVYNLTDSIYSDQMSLFGWKYKHQTHYSENIADDKDAQEMLNTESKAWKHFKGDSEDLLILASIGDDGTDVQESLIPECK